MGPAERSTHRGVSGRSVTAGSRIRHDAPLASRVDSTSSRLVVPLAGLDGARRRCPVTAELHRSRLERVGRAVRLLVPALAVAAAPPTFAGDAESDEMLVETLPAGRVTRQELPFALVTDPSTPGAGATSLGYRFGFGSGISADRPLPMDIAASGPSYGVTVAHGFGDRLAPFVSVTSSQDATGTTSANVAVGATVLLTRPSAPFRLAVAAAAIHEGASGASGGSARSTSARIWKRWSAPMPKAGRATSSARARRSISTAAATSSRSAAASA